MASLDTHDQRVDLLGTVQVLQEHLTASVCQTVFEQTRTTERARKWTLEALAEFWTAVILRATGLNLSSKLSFALSWGPLQRGGPPWHISTREPVPMLSFGIAHRSHCQRWER